MTDATVEVRAAARVRRCVDEMFANIESGAVVPELLELLALSMLCVRHGCYAEAKRIVTWLERFQ